ncbi:hypothetical protein HAX54_039406 [Datura stramonium]|uniref:Uncharacterized protein n=1 Tax=Datura stramonium TaxID=4076 RepID=A0ABS8VLX4_DATST|nr:hypothetical protein [Datura stramonium]
MHETIDFGAGIGKCEEMMHETTEFGAGIGQHFERNIYDKLWEILVMTVVVKATTNEGNFQFNQFQEIPSEDRRNINLDKVGTPQL